jgi:hypothetical protein
MNISGRATADEIDRGLRIVKERIIGRSASLIILGHLVVGLVVALGPFPASADTDKDIHTARSQQMAADCRQCRPAAVVETVRKRLPPGLPGVIFS